MSLQETRMQAPPASLFVEEGQIPVPRAPLHEGSDDGIWAGTSHVQNDFFMLCNKLSLSFLGDMLYLRHL